jgi:hypothetical protein
LNSPHGNQVQGISPNASNLLKRSKNHRRYQQIVGGKLFDDRHTRQTTPRFETDKNATAERGSFPPCKM